MNHPAKLLFVVCHPDDEALWAGGLLHGLNSFPDVQSYVLCLSGHDPDSPREAEFEAARLCVGYHAGVVLGGPLRQANEPLPPVSDTLEQGLESLQLKSTDIDLFITHSPFGDEHMNPHHVQACIEGYAWASANDVPFACFTCLTFPSSRLQPLLHNMKRRGSLQLLGMARTQLGLLQRVVRFLVNQPWRYPYLYLQWLVDLNAKRNMLACYRSIDLDSHEKAYAMFTNNVESLYLYDSRGEALFQKLIEQMEVPGSPDYFPGDWTIDDLLRRVRNKLNKII